LRIVATEIQIQKEKFSKNFAKIILVIAVQDLSTCLSPRTGYKFQFRIKSGSLLSAAKGDPGTVAQRRINHVCRTASVKVYFHFVIKNPFFDFIPKIAHNCRQKLSFVAKAVELAYGIISS
jgi:hypothetical protein